MNYLTFHLVFNLPILLLLGWLPSTREMPVEAWTVILVILAVVMVFTAPWDNYAVKCGIWGFPREKYWFRIGYLPVEEYAFFWIQSLQVCLLVWWLVSGSAPVRDVVTTALWDDPLVWISLTLLAICWAGLGWTGRDWLRQNRRWHYAWHLFFWFGPVIVLQWILAGPVFWARLDILILATLGMGTWLTAADVFAIHRNIWFFDEAQITGRKWFRVLPWEEAAFFYVTSLVVAQSFLMLLPAWLR
jgi:putative membrane protein